MLGITPHTLARTYDHPSKDPWEAVQLYELAMTYPDNWGAQRVATAINTDPDTPFRGVTRSEIRTWVDDDGMPDAARAVATARAHGWMASEWTPTTRALARLTVGNYACGSITTKTYAPSWSPDDPDTEAQLTAALTQVGCGYRHISRTARAQGDEYRPARHGTHLGRALVVAGVPIGDKNAATVTGLPAWVADAPAPLRTTLAQLIVRERSVTQHGKATRRIQTDRDQQYCADVAALLAAVSGEQVTASATGVTISAAAARQFRRTDSSEPAAEHRTTTESATND